ncbi:MAG: hypothetical protein LIO94_07920 [Clostridiales bacterium]|nr:hypothetical protein [Clostridiales bacterium]
MSIRENFILHSSLDWKLSQLFRSVGLKKEGEKMRMNWNALPGLTGKGHVIQVPGTKDPSKMFNQMEKLYPKEMKKYSAGNF